MKELLYQSRINIQSFILVFADVYKQEDKTKSYTSHLLKETVTMKFFHPYPKRFITHNELSQESYTWIIESFSFTTVYTTNETKIVRRKTFSQICQIRERRESARFFIRMMCIKIPFSRTVRYFRLDFFLFRIPNLVLLLLQLTTPQTFSWIKWSLYVVTTTQIDLTHDVFGDRRGSYAYSGLNLASSLVFCNWSKSDIH